MLSQKIRFPSILGLSSIPLCRLTLFELLSQAKLQLQRDEQVFGRRPRAFPSTVNTVYFPSKILLLTLLSQGTLIDRFLSLFLVKAEVKIVF